LLIPTNTHLSEAMSMLSTMRSYNLQEGEYALTDAAQIINPGQYEIQVNGKYSFVDSNCSGRFLLADP
jgi:hypothetical protein